ncbi:hypothetical protein MN608_03667 [Microdochium nivale]|nr:hypothetical protein MN608_03667 [Microdochium nivale]
MAPAAHDSGQSVCSLARLASRDQCRPFGRTSRPTSSGQSAQRVPRIRSRQQPYLPPTMSPRHLSAAGQPASQTVTRNLQLRRLLIDQGSGSRDVLSTQRGLDSCSKGRIRPAVGYLYRTASSTMGNPVRVTRCILPHRQPSRPIASGRTSPVWIARITRISRISHAPQTMAEWCPKTVVI